MGNKNRKKERYLKEAIIILFFGVIIFLLIISYLSIGVKAADPQGPDDLTNVENRTKGGVGAKMVNISGGNIGVFNLNATMQNTRWKAFIGNVTGLFTLDDAGGSTIYDWTLSSINGRVYATRNSSSISWVNVNCSNITFGEQENIELEHTGIGDNITATFNFSAGATHAPFYVGGTFIGANSCPTLNTYRNNVSDDSFWEEMLLYDNLTTSTIYATVIDDDETGYDGSTYDFQMIVPENGNASFQSSIAYYIYLEIGS